jgi:malonyl-CoA O-methyltransferase
MRTLKETIAHNFSKAAPTYEKVATVQSQAAAHLVNFFQKNRITDEVKSILDIGAGTGFVTEELFLYFPHAQYTLNDISADMLERARIKFPKLCYIVADAENTSFSTHDLTISNLAFQWFTSPEKTLHSLWKNTKALCFSIPTTGSFQTWQDMHESLGKPSPLLHFPSHEDVETLCLSLEPSKTLFETKSYSLSFENPKEFIHYLHRLGAHTPSSTGHISSLKNLLSKTAPLEIHYNILFALLEKK